MLVTLGLEEELAVIPDDLVLTRSLESAEAADRIALHLSTQIEKVI